MQQFVLLHVVYGKFTSQVSFSPRCLVADKTDKKKQRILRLKVSVLDFFSILSARLCLHYQFTLSSQQNRNQQHVHWDTRQVKGKIKWLVLHTLIFFRCVCVRLCLNTSASASIGSRSLFGWPLCLTLCPALWPSAPDPGRNKKNNNIMASHDTDPILSKKTKQKKTLSDAAPCGCVAEAWPEFWASACWISLWPEHWAPQEQTEVLDNPWCPTDNTHTLS